jgi:hypothetical protein
VIKDIICSVEPKEIRKEVVMLNREAEFPLFGFMVDPTMGNLLYIRTARGVIIFKVELNEDEKEVMTDEEFRALSGWAAEAGL